MLQQRYFLQSVHYTAQRRRNTDRTFDPWFNAVHVLGDFGHQVTELHVAYLVVVGRVEDRLSEQITEPRFGCLGWKHRPWVDTQD